MTILYIIFFGAIGILLLILTAGYCMFYMAARADEQAEKLYRDMIVNAEQAYLESQFGINDHERRRCSKKW